MKNFLLFKEQQQFWKEIYGKLTPKSLLFIKFIAKQVAGVNNEMNR